MLAKQPSPLARRVSHDSAADENHADLTKRMLYEQVMPLFTPSLVQATAMGLLIPVRSSLCTQHTALYATPSDTPLLLLCAAACVAGTSSFRDDSLTTQLRRWCGRIRKRHRPYCWRPDSRLGYSGFWSVAWSRAGIIYIGTVGRWWGVEYERLGVAMHEGPCRYAHACVCTSQAAHHSNSHLLPPTHTSLPLTPPPTPLLPTPLPPLPSFAAAAAQVSASPSFRSVGRCMSP